MELSWGNWASLITGFATLGVVGVILYQGFLLRHQINLSTYPLLFPRYYFKDNNSTKPYLRIFNIGNSNAVVVYIKINSEQKPLHNRQRLALLNQHEDFEDTDINLLEYNVWLTAIFQYYDIFGSKHYHEIVFRYQERPSPAIEVSSWKIPFFRNLNLILLPRRIKHNFS